MSRPVVGSVAEDIYSSLFAFHEHDEALGWPLLHYCEAIGGQYQTVHDVVVDSDDGTLAWSRLFDIDEAPEWALPYLGQFIGVRIPAGMTDESAIREWIKEAAGFKRGTIGALKAAIRSTLIGDRDVIIRERYDPAAPGDDSAYHITFVTFSAQTPDPAFTLAVAKANKVGGLVIHHSVIDGQDWQSVFDDYATWQDVANDYASWQHVADDTP